MTPLAHLPRRREPVAARASRWLLLLALSLALCARGCEAIEWDWQEYWESVGYHSGLACACALSLGGGGLCTSSRGHL